MNMLRICVSFFLAVVAMLSTNSALAIDKSSMSVDDMMKLEEFGAAVGDPSGRWFVFERLRPYEESDDFSFRTYAMRKTGHQIWRYDITSGDVPELLPGLDPMPHNYLQGFSPSGRFLAIMQYRFGALSLGAYDMELEKVVWFSQMPAFSRSGDHNPIWISDDELMFAALPDGELPELTSVRAHTGRTLAKAWEDAWRGDAVTASEVRSFAEDRSAEQQPGYLVRANARTGESRVVAQGLYADLRLSPTRRHVAALAVSQPRPIDSAKLVEDDLHRYHLTIFDLDTEQPRLLASDIEFFPYTITWALDGRRLALYGWLANQTPRSGRFYVIDLDTDAVVRYDHTGVDLASERERGWLQRPERVAFLGDALAVFGRPIPEREDQAPRFSYKDFRPVDLPRSDWYAIFSDGSISNLTEGLPDVSSVLVHAGKDHMTVIAADGVYRLYADGQRRRLTPPEVESFQFLPRGTFATHGTVIRPEFTDDALFSIGRGDEAKVVMVDLRDGHEGETIIVGVPKAGATPLGGALVARAVLFRAKEGPASRLLVSKSSDDDTPRELARINAHLADLNLGSWQVVSYEVDAPEGEKGSQTIESCVLLPPGYNKTRPPPLVVDVYPNSRPTCKDDGERVDYPNFNSPYLWAGRGYAYARLSTPRALIRTKDGPIAGMPALVEAGINALVAERFADPKRVVVSGFSQGGVSALYVAANSSHVSAAIAINSWADLFSHYFGAYGVYSYVYGKYFGDFWRYDSTEGTDFGIGRTPFEDPEIYIRNSPVFLAPQISVPVLLVHSDMDDFSMSQFDEMYAALVRAGKDARYVRYWGEGHGPSSPANIRDLWERMDDFLIENEVAPQSPQSHNMN